MPEVLIFKRGSFSFGFLSQRLWGHFFNKNQGDAPYHLFHCSPALLAYGQVSLLKIDNRN